MVTTSGTPLLPRVGNHPGGWGSVESGRHDLQTLVAHARVVSIACEMRSA